MKSLMDVAKSMDQQAPPSRPQAPEATATTSLVDFAKKQQAPGDASGTKKPMTLMDVARQENSAAASARGSDVAPGTKSLQSIAQEINDEESKRIEKALATTANDVRTEQRERQSNVLKEAAAEVQQEESQAALNLVAKIEMKSSSCPSPPVEKPISNQKQHHEARTDYEDENDGYSSFGDQEEEQETQEKKQKQKPTKSKKKLIFDDDENESDGGEGNTGPERTIASDTPESKTFLRAVYRADLRTIQDMLGSEDASATTADQHGWSGLHWAASQGHTKILELLLKKGAPVNAVDHINGWAPLHVAAVRELLPCVKLLLQSGADPRLRDSYGDSASEILRAIRGKKRDAFLQTLARFQTNNKSSSSSA